MDPVYDSTGRQVAYFATMGSWALGERFLQFRDWRRGARHDRSQDRGTLWWIVVTLVVAFGGAFTLANIAALDLPGAVGWIVGGLVVAWLGIGLRVWAVVTLGRFFTTTVRVREDYVVVSGGPYRWVRHPSYTGLLLILAGLGIALANVGSLVVLIVLPAVGTLRRIRVEEAALEGQLGAAYTDFARDRARLVPHLW